ncbi:MAG: bacillithiol biosynthesis cysteine-adding enzyme BshC [Bacteroidota bacterium]
MDIDCMPFSETGYFSALIRDYLGEKESLRPFYHYFPKLKDFKNQMEEKSLNFSQEYRDNLYHALQGQYQGFEMGPSTLTNIKQLKEPITFTVTTGHQLNLFTGPLYFLYKIISTINLTRELKKAYPKYNFVPIYWMATEDHDFEEIRFFNFKGKKLQWNREASGAVGDLDTEGLARILEAFSHELGEGSHAEKLKTLFLDTYVHHDNLAAATRYLANALFGDYGLVILDGDDKTLKRQLIPLVKKDLFEGVGFNQVSHTVSQLKSLKEKYKIQVNPREINYFYLADGVRERIVEKEGRFYVKDTDLEFSKEELTKELHTYPERFSPNVIARPLYQEMILPNLCYIGGGGEIAYWLQLKAMFQTFGIPFPILLLRNSALVITEKQHKKLQKLHLSPKDLFLAQNDLINKKIREISNIDIDFSPQRKHLEQQFTTLYELAELTDKSFLGAVKAQEAKQKNGLDKLEKRLLKAQKMKLADHVSRMTEIQNQLFPNAGLQERSLNFSELYLELGDALIPRLMQALKPLRQEFMILTL